MSIPNAPEMKTIRTVQNDDAGLPSLQRNGVNLADYDEIAVSIALKLSASAATVEPYYWSPEAAAFLPLETPITIVAAGAGVRKVIRVARALSVFFEVTGIAGGVADTDRVLIELSGLPNYDQVG